MFYPQTQIENFTHHLQCYTYHLISSLSFARHSSHHTTDSSSDLPPPKKVPPISATSGATQISVSSAPAPHQTSTSPDPDPASPHACMHAGLSDGWVISALRVVSGGARDERRSISPTALARDERFGRGGRGSSVCLSVYVSWSVDRTMARAHDDASSERGFLARSEVARLRCLLPFPLLPRACSWLCCLSVRVPLADTCPAREGTVQYVPRPGHRPGMIIRRRRAGSSAEELSAVS